MTKAPRYAFPTLLLFPMVGACGDAATEDGGVRRGELHSVRTVIVDSLVPEDREYYRVSAGGFASDGAVTVANAGSSEVFQFDSTGRFIGAFGAAGAGPGEFNSLSWVGEYREDSIAAFDAGQRRFHIFAEDGRFGRSVSPRDIDLQRWAAAGVTADGSFVVYGAAGIAELGAGLRRDSIVAVQLDPSGASPQVVAEALGNEVYMDIMEGRGQISEIAVPRPYGLRLTIVAGGRTLAIADGADRHVRVIPLDPLDGARAGSVAEVPLRRSPLPADARRAYVDGRLVGLSGEALRRQRDFLERIPFPERQPSLSGLLLDHVANRIWVAAYRPDGSARNEWIVMRDDAGPLGRVRLPEDAEVMSARNDYLLVLRRDSLGVEWVERWVAEW